MVEYEIIAKKTNCGDNRFENFFNRFGLSGRKKAIRRWRDNNGKKQDNSGWYNI